MMYGMTILWSEVFGNEYEVNLKGLTLKKDPIKSC